MEPVPLDSHRWAQAEEGMKLYWDTDDRADRIERIVAALVCWGFVAWIFVCIVRGLA